MVSGNAKILSHQPGFHVVTLLGVSLLFFFPFLGARDFWELENQYAEVVRVMLLDGDYLVPKLNDTLFPDSPPLFFWVAVLFCFLAGGVGELPLRLPSALSATEMILIVYFFLQRKFNPRLAFFSAIVLASSVLTVHVERHVPVNMLFYLFIAAAMFLFMEILIFGSQRSGHAYGAWSCMALACLTNGPVGLLLPSIVVYLYLSLSRQWPKVSRLRPLSGAALFVLVTAPWFVYLARKRPTDWLDSLSVHLRWFDHGGPDQQMFFSFPLAFAPWCFLLIPAGICFWRERSKVWDSPILFFLIWFAVALLLSVLPLGRHNHYLFLAYIPVAVGIGFYLDQLITCEANDAVRIWTNYSVVFFCAVFIIGGLSGPFLIRDIWPFVSLSAAVFGASVVGFAGMFLYVWRRYGNPASLI